MSPMLRVSLVLGINGLSGALFAGSVETTIDPSSGTYMLRSTDTGWELSGSIGIATRIQKAAGQDAIGSYHETKLSWAEGAAFTGRIRTYTDQPIVWFRLEYPSKSTDRPVAFPNFTSFPQGLYAFSHRDEMFAPGSFRLNDTSTPWLRFDNLARALILSPASNFLSAKMVGDESHRMGVSMNTRLKSVPGKTCQDSLLVFSHSIGRAWETWGDTLRKLHHRGATLPDPTVETLGYWTDNGSDYYYNFERDKGYTNTLLEVIDRYRKAGTPVGYLQLDSWWYRKLTDKISGEPGPERRNSKLPFSDWNRYGGIDEYRATTDLFPEGLAAFQKKLGLPMLVHGRWIDQKSPLRNRFEVSGVAQVDRAYWEDTAKYLSSAGVTCYEQDWLSHIYANSPEMVATHGVAERFTDGMAESMRKRGIVLQYCMAPTRFVLNGVRYSNLSTVRTTTDRFTPEKWAQFAFGSPLVHAVGARPWTDVFRSRETGNLIMAVLSEGQVGTGDALGREDFGNLRKVARTDTLLVKPDAPLVPTDSTYLNEAKKNGRPFIGTTYTDHSGLKTQYVFAFPRSTNREVLLPLDGLSLIYDVNTGRSSVSRQLRGQMGPANYGFYIVAPITKTGIGFLGDLNKFVSTGKRRIERMVDGLNGLEVTVAFAKGEEMVQLEGASPISPRIRCLQGSAKLIGYDTANGMFTLRVTPDRGRARVVLDGRK